MNPLDTGLSSTDVPVIMRKSYIAPATWDALRLDYVAGNGKVRELAAKHGINPGTAETHAKRERWTAQRSEFLSKKREMMSSPAPAFLPVLNPPNGQLPPANSPSDGPSFARTNQRFHSLAVPLLERIQDCLMELALPLTASERLALANTIRLLTQTVREILGIPLVAAIKRKETRLDYASISPINPRPSKQRETPPCEGTASQPF